MLPNYFEPAMDRQAEFFISPLFDKHYVARELVALENEYNRHVKNDAVRLIYVLKQLVNPLHPYNRFELGNLASLPGEKQAETLRQASVQFYLMYYTLNRMNLGTTWNYFSWFCIVSVAFLNARYTTLSEISAETVLIRRLYFALPFINDLNV